MALEDIINGIYDKGKIEIENIRKSSDEQVNKILEEARKKAENFLETNKKKIIKELEQEKIMKLSSTNVELKREYINKLDSLINDYVDNIKKELKNLRKTENYQKFLTNIISKGLKELNVNQNSAIIYISEKDRDLVGNYVNIKFNQNLDEYGGAIIETKDGKMIYNGSLENIFNEKINYLKEKLYEKIKEEL